MYIHFLYSDTRLHFIDKQNAVVNHRCCKQYAVEAVQNTAVPRNQIAVILDAHLPFERRRRQIAKLRDHAADYRDHHAFRNHIRLYEIGEDTAKQHTAEHTADRAFLALFWAQMRAEFMLADCHAHKVCHDVCAERRQKYQPDQIAVRGLVNQYDVEGKEYNI